MRINDPTLLQKKWQTRVGQVWQLGPHRVMCGDSTRAKDVQRLMQGQLAAKVITSPPYLQQREYRDGSTAHVSDWDSLMRSVFTAAPHSPQTQYFVNLGLVHRQRNVVPYWDGFIAWFRTQGRNHVGWYVWDKGHGMPGMSQGRLGLCFEFIFHFAEESVPARKCVPCKNAGFINNGSSRKRDGSIHPMSGIGKPTQSHKIHDSIIRQSCSASGYHSHGHPAPYPVGVVKPFHDSWPGLTFDPFLGSGTTLIAAHDAEQICYGMELSPAYLACTLERFHIHTGIVPNRI